MFKIVAFLLILLFIAVGCGNIPEFEDGYQFGDITRLTARSINELEQSRRIYCDQAHDAQSRYHSNIRDGPQSAP